MSKMNVLNQEQKAVRLKQFLRKLSEDPSLCNQDEFVELSSLSEILTLLGYQLGNERIDMAELFSLLLKKRGLEANLEDIMEYVMQGGLIHNYINDERYEARSSSTIQQ